MTPSTRLRLARDDSRIDDTQSLGCAYLKSGKLRMTVAYGGIAHSLFLPDLFPHPCYLIPLLREG